MSYQQDDWDREWEGLEPVQVGKQNWGCRIGIIAVILMVLFICLAGAFLLWREFGTAGSNQPDSPPPFVLATPTALLELTAPPAAPQENQPGEPTLPAMAATATLISSNGAHLAITEGPAFAAAKNVTIYQRRRLFKP